MENEKIIKTLTRLEGQMDKISREIKSVREYAEGFKTKFLEFEKICNTRHNTHREQIATLADAIGGVIDEAADEPELPANETNAANTVTEVNENEEI